jgi:hypothetical protein
MWVPPPGRRSFRNNDARGKFAAGVVGFIVAGMFLIACHRKTPAPGLQKGAVAPPLTAKTPSLSPEEESCRGFVQGFYDWYWNRYAEPANSVDFDLHKLPNVETVLKRTPPVLSPELSQLLADEEKKKQASHQIGNMDFDPFWGNQNAQGMYMVGRVLVTGDKCKARVGREGEIVEVQKAGASWVFVNFYYCFSAYDPTVERHCPDTDLVEILKK